MNNGRKAARSLAVERYDFLWHFAIYLLANAVLVGIWAFEWLVEGILDAFWPVYPIVIWGIFVLAHYLSVYSGRNHWIERETERILRTQD